ncbi:MAG: response regulator transcription factor [Pseudomonadota bacterium]
MAAESLKLFLVEDQAMVLGALAALLDREPDLVVAGTATSAEEARQALPETAVDVLLTDIELPGDSGLDLARYAADALPDMRVIVLTTFARSGYLERAMAAGVRGYVLKDSRASELAETIRRVHAGQRVVDAELVAASWTETNPLSEREQQCLKLAAEGLPNSDIAQRVFLSEGTVRNYLSAALGKLNATNRTEAARLAQQKGWI